MSGGDTGERKEFAATRRKLADSRDRGQVAQSRDAVTAAGLIAGFGFLWLRREALAAEMVTATDVAFDFGAEPFDRRLAVSVDALSRLAVDVLAPFLGVVATASVLAGLVVTGGVVFSVTPITPDVTRIDPVSGLQRLFGKQAWINFALSTLKVVAALAVLCFVATLALGALLTSPRCGVGCALIAFTAAAWPMLIAAILLLLSIAALDVTVQRALFLDEMKMTRTELKQEYKNTEGDPQMRGRRKRMRRQMLETPTGPARSTLVVADGARLAIGLRYAEGETPAPLVVAKGRGASAARLRRVADDIGAPVLEDAALARDLARTIDLGDYVTGALTSPVVDALQRSGGVA